MPRARFDTRRDVNFAVFANAASNELEKLAMACEPASFGLNDEDGKMDSDIFSTPLVPEQTDLVNVIRGYPLEGTDSA